MNAESNASDTAPASVRFHRQLLHVVLAGAGQAALLLLALQFFGAFIFSFFPFLTFLAYGDFILTLFAFLAGSAWLAHRFPYFAGQRAVAAFMFAVLWDAAVARVTERPGFLSWDTTELYIDLSFVLTGMVACGGTAALAGRSREQLRAWCREEWDEFRESVGLIEHAEAHAAHEDAASAPASLPAAARAPVDPAAETRELDALPIETEAFAPLPRTGILSPPPRRLRPVSAPEETKPAETPK